MRAMTLATTGGNLALAALALARQSASTDTILLALDSPDPIDISYYSCTNTTERQIAK
jgi:hypothetical protein